MSAILEVENLTKVYNQKANPFTAVDGISLTLLKGECLGIVGESGSGKSTLAKMIARLETPTVGDIILNGQNITSIKGGELRNIYKKIQMVFQSPVESFNPRLKIGNAIIDSKVNFGASRKGAERDLVPLMKLVGLNEEYIHKYPHQLSGGECQRAAIARAIAIDPDIVICDEITSSLDVSIQAQINALIQTLKRERNMSYLFISHDLAVVQMLCERVIIMRNGKIVDMGNTQSIIDKPAHPYTRLLLSSIFPTDPDSGWEIP